MPRPPPVDEAISAAYRAAAARELWPEALRQVGAAFSGAFALIGLVDTAHGQTNSITSEVFPESRRALYRGSYFPINPRSAYAARAAVGEVFFDAKIGERRALDRHPYYAEYLRTGGYAHFISSNLARSATRRVNLSVQRSARTGAARDEEIKDFARLARHVSAAFALSERLSAAEARADDLSRALDAGLGAALVLGPGALVLTATDSGGALLHAGGPLVQTGGGVCAALASERGGFARALDGALSGGHAAQLTLSAPQGRRWQVRLTPLPDRELGVVKNRALLLAREMKSLRDPEMLMRLLGLTGAEALLALALADGERPADHARKRGVSLNTVRTHLASLRQKLEARSQSAVVARVLDALR